MNLIPLLVPAARAMLARLSVDQKRQMLGVLRNLLDAMARGDVELTKWLLDDLNADPSVRALVLEWMVDSEIVQH